MILKEPRFRELVSKVAKHDAEAAKWLMEEYSKEPEKYRSENQPWGRGGFESLSHLMDWRKTPQGDIYWRNLNNKVGGPWWEPMP